MPDSLRADYYRERIQALKSLIKDAPDDLSRQVYSDLLAEYERDLATVAARLAEKPKRPSSDST